jgi:hypothetical protein
MGHTNNSMKELSKVNWSVDENRKNEYPGDDNIKLGCLMRIAAATEAMAKNHDELIRLKDHYKSVSETAIAAKKRLEYQVRGLKGTITRMKNKRA